MRAFLGIAAFFALLLVLLGSCDKGETASSPAASEPAASRTPKVHVTKAGHFACDTRDNLDLAIRIASAGDQEALATLLDGSTCTILRGGTQVYVEHLGLGVVQFRPAGETMAAWTVVEAID